MEYVNDEVLDLSTFLDLIDRQELGGQKDCLEPVPFEQDEDGRALEDLLDDLLREEEEWRDVKGYEGLYSVSSFGRVKRLGASFQKDGKTDRILKLINHSKGYLYVNLCKSGNVKMMLVHRLVAEAFLPNPENKEQVNHMDSNRSNNLLKNLEWATALENTHHGIEHGDINHTKLDTEDAWQIKMLLEYSDMKQKDIAKEYNVHPVTVSNIKTGKRWSHVDINFPPE